MGKNTSSEINEDLMKEIMSKGYPIDQDSFESSKEESDIVVKDNNQLQMNKPKQKPKKTSKVKNSSKIDYVEKFLGKNADFSNEGVIVITAKTHNKLSKIVKILGGKKSSLRSYVENIICDHFEEYSDEINKLYSENIQNIIDL